MSQRLQTLPEKITKIFNSFAKIVRSENLVRVNLYVRCMVRGTLTGSAYIAAMSLSISAMVLIISARGAMMSTLPSLIDGMSRSGAAQVLTSNVLLECHTHLPMKTISFLRSH